MTGTSVMKELNVHNSKAGKILRNQLERNNSRQHFRSNEDKFMFRLFVIMLTKIWKYLFSPMLLIKIASTIRDHSFSTCAKFPENLTFLNPWYAPYFSSVYFLEKYGGLSESVAFAQNWRIVQTRMDQRGDYMKMSFDHFQIQKWMLQTRKK